MGSLEHRASKGRGRGKGKALDMDRLIFFFSQEGQPLLGLVQNEWGGVWQRKFLSESGMDVGSPDE